MSTVMGEEIKQWTQQRSAARVGDGFGRTEPIDLKAFSTHRPKKARVAGWLGKLQEHGSQVL